MPNALVSAGTGFGAGLSELGTLGETGMSKIDMYVKGFLHRVSKMVGAAQGYGSQEAIVRMALEIGIKMIRINLQCF